MDSHEKHHTSIFSSEHIESVPAFPRPLLKVCYIPSNLLHAYSRYEILNPHS